MKLPLIVFLVSLGLSSGWLFRSLNQDNGYKPVQITRSSDSRSAIGSVAGDHFSQTIELPAAIANTPRFSLGLEGATYRRINPGTINVELTQGTTQQRFSLSAKSMGDNQTVFFELTEPGFKPGAAEIEVYSPDNQSGVGSTFWAFNAETSEPLMRNGVAEPLKLIVNFYQRNEKRWDKLEQRLGSGFLAWFLLLVFSSTVALLAASMVPMLRRPMDSKPI